MKRVCICALLPGLKHSCDHQQCHCKASVRVLRTFSICNNSATNAKANLS